MMNNTFKLIKYGAVDEVETKADVIGLADYVQSIQKERSENPDVRTSFRDCSRFLISNMGDSVVILRWGLTDTFGRSLTDNWAFQTIERWRRRDTNEWVCADVDYLVPVDLVAEMVDGAVDEVKANIESMFTSSVEKGITRAVENGIRRGVDDAMKTLGEIQSEREVLEKRLEKLDQLETKAAARESKKGQRKPRSLDGYVYLVKSVTGFYKIGRTVNPTNRLRTFNVKLPFEVSFECLIQTDDMYALESELHAKFADKRVNGEWFNLTDSDLSLINQYAASQQTDGGDVDGEAG